MHPVPTITIHILFILHHTFQYKRRLILMEQVCNYLDKHVEIIFWDNDKQIKQSICASP